MLAEKAAQKTIKNDAALDQTAQHIPISFERAEIPVEARCDGFSGWIRKALVGKEAASQRAGREGDEPGLLRAAQTRKAASRVHRLGQRRAAPDEARLEALTHMVPLRRTVQGHTRSAVRLMA